MKTKFLPIRPFIALICFGAAVAMTTGAVADTLTPSNGTITYTDGPTVPNPTGILGAPVCSVPNSCSDFTVAVRSTAARSSAISGLATN